MVATVLRNLISNSLKFTEKGGSIKLSAYKDSSRVTVIVEDTGVGMPKEIADRIFDINFKHSTKGTNKEEGSGLGLKLCKEFVEKNNGSIRVESTVGVGSKFIFTLPTGEEIA
jgi:signal transduction histidine kinase